MIKEMHFSIVTIVMSRSGFFTNELFYLFQFLHFFEHFAGQNKLISTTYVCKYVLSDIFT